ncbi:hypothetical protein F511_01378 [Dorcoceras hygrometricum]|uniref:BRI1 kinase inhibitor 1-like n=1 Tax=Dorcoceras hygrometricum TaxID=472368 RepID=A0A2Z7D614_9LAMI|nr:hypothetical protein F511_01378 [Dorcoceras hygrometricum]
MEIQSQMDRKAKEESLNESKFNPQSPTSSPNHDFSFTSSLHPQPKVAEQNKSNTSFAIDLSPADIIFFHGHLLPLSNHPVFPHSSTDSLDSLTLPAEELSREYINTSSKTYTDQQEHISIDHIIPTHQEKKHDKARQETDGKQKRKQKINLRDVVKRYMRFINPFRSLRNRRTINPRFHGQTYSSFSGNLRVRSKKEVRGRRGGFSAPASMRNSPTNSGLLVESGTATPTARDGTMEELQAAIQSAIAHCKKSIAAEETTIHVNSL